jgi:hypothetical protein
VIAINVFPAANRAMLRMESKNHSSLTTLEHRWPVVVDRRGTRHREWATSGTLKCGQKIVQSARYSSAPTEAVHDDALVELIAWFWTEGSLQPYGAGTITQSPAVNADNVDRIRACLEKVFGAPTPPGCGRMRTPVWRESLRRNRPLVEFWFNKAAGQVLGQFAPNRVPLQRFLQELTAEQLDLYLDTAFRADGHNSRHHAGNVLSQRSRQRAEAFQLALILAGRSTRLSRSDTRSGAMWRVSWRTAECFSPREAQRLRPAGVRQVVYDGPVWCPTTEHGTWLARRDGQVYFTGNSSSFFQDSDLLIGVEKTVTDDVNKLKVLGARNAAQMERYLRWEWDTGTFEELDYDPFAQETKDDANAQSGFSS